MRHDPAVFRDWIFLLIYLAAIFAILPFSAYLAQGLMKANSFFENLILFFIYGTVMIVGVTLAIYVIAADKGYKFYRFIALGLILFFGIYNLQEIKEAQDKLHIIEYSILAFFIFRVLRFYNPTTALYFWCVVFVGLAGFTDEWIQSFIPGRAFSLLDIRTDLCAGILSELAIALVVCPKLEKWRLRMTFLKRRFDEKQQWVKRYKTRQS